MSSLFDSLVNQLGPDTIGQIGRSLGTDRVTAGTASAAAISMLLAALSRNAAAPEGAEALHGALARDHDGSLLGDLGTFLGSGQTAPGDAILGHVLGSRRPRIESGLSQATGLDAASAGKLLAMLAPIVLSSLGKAQRQQDLDAGSLAGMLRRENQQMQDKQPQAMSGLGSLLDADGDGDFDMGDAAKHGLGMLGKLFGGR